MSGARDVRAMLHAGDGGPPSSPPDHAEIRRRGRRLVVTRVAGIAASVSALAGAVVLVATQSPADDRGALIIEQPGPSDPADRSSDADDDVAVDATTPADDGLDDDAEPSLGCPPPALRPTYLPWLEEGEEVPEPTHTWQPTSIDRDAAEPQHGALLWTADPEAFDPEDPWDTDHFIISSAARYEPDRDFPQIELRGTMATLVWGGDPGLGPLGLHWEEGGVEGCEALGAGLRIHGMPDYLDLPEPPDEQTNPEGFERWSADGEAAIEWEIVAIAESLVPTDTDHTDDAPPPAACVDAADIRNAAPDDSGSLFLYLPCRDDGHDRFPPDLYRHDAATSPTGDVVVDAENLLLELFGGPPSHLADDGFDMPGIDIELGLGLTFGPAGLAEPGRLVIDLVLLDGAGLMNTSTASMMWHSTLAANLLQFSEVTSVELRSGGSCDAYSGQFEGEGCRILDHDDVPWPAR